MCKHFGLCWVGVAGEWRGKDAGNAACVAAVADDARRCQTQVEEKRERRLRRDASTKRKFSC